MKRIIGYVLFNLCLTYNMQAQSLLPAKKDINPSKEFSRIEMPGLKMGVYSFQNKEINLKIGDYLHFNKGHLPFPIIDASVDYWKVKPAEHWPSNHLLTHDDIMKLPAVNTYDIIKILDKDRMLTNW
ncbi:MAG: hypothetical protein IPF62_16780 [Bacteroidetes bacterium]|nr:hypothetical protein [Bacteroidota bacterium]